MSLLRGVYLACAVIGAILPLLVSDAGYAAAPLKLAGLTVETPGLVTIRWDILIAAIAISIWSLAETYVRKNWTALIALPVTWAIGVGCGLPLYLFLRTAPPR